MAAAGFIKWCDEGAAPDEALFYTPAILFPWLEPKLPKVSERCCYCLMGLIKLWVREICDNFKRYE